MADPRRSADRQGGFTLLELLIALGILSFGITALIGVLSVGVGTRRGAEMRTQAVLLSDQILHHIQERIFADHPIPQEFSDEQDLAIDPVVVDQIDGFAGLRYSVSFVVDVERPDLVLAIIRVSWRDQGEDVGQEFRRILPRAAPFSYRVRNRHGEDRR